MKKRYLLCLFLIFLFVIKLLPSNKVYAKDIVYLKDITTDKNGLVKIDVIDPIKLDYKITITPKEGYYVDEVRLYYSKGDDFYINENIATFDKETSNSYIWSYRNSNNCNRQDMEVIFKKIRSTGTLQLTALKSNYTYGEDIKIKVQLIDKNGKDIKISKTGALCLYAPETSWLYYSGTFSKQYYQISKDNIINIDSMGLNAKKDPTFSGYYVDSETGFITDYSDVKVNIDSITPVVNIVDSVQSEGNVMPVKATILPSFNYVPVSYEILFNGNYKWVSDPPQWPGIYNMKAEFSGLDIATSAEATAKLTVKENDAAKKYKAKTYITSNDKNNYIQAKIKDNNIILEGASQDVNIIGYSCTFNNKGIILPLIGNNRTFNTNISLDGLKPGAYEIRISPRRVNSVPTDHITADILLIKENNDIYFIQSKAYEINEHSMNNIESIPDTPIDLSDKQYNEIIRKAKDLTSTATIDYEKMRILYTWVAENIIYNFDEFWGREAPNPQDAVSVYNSKKAVCAGYSNLLHVMLLSVGIKDKLIYGYAKVGDDYICTLDHGVGHGWNVAYSKDKNRWIIIDSTWGSNNSYTYGKCSYNYCQFNYFDCSLQAFSNDHLFEYIEKPTEGPDPDFIDSCTISVGQTISFLKNSPEFTRSQLNISPSYILRNNDNNLKALNAGVCNVDIQMNANGKTYTKSITITVIDPNLIKNFDNAKIIKLNKAIKDDLSNEVYEKYYLLKTNNKASEYTITVKNSSLKYNMTCTIYDNNGGIIDYFDCNANSTNTIDELLDPNKSYYVNVYSDSQDDISNINYMITIN